MHADSPSSHRSAFCYPISLPASHSFQSSIHPCIAACASRSSRNHRPSSPSRRRFLAHALIAALISTKPSLAENTSSTSTATNSATGAEVPTSSETKPTAPPNSSSNQKATPPKWSYKHPTGPDEWGSLSPEYAAAETGTSQSPIPLSYRSALSPTVQRPVLSSSVAKFSFKLRENPVSESPSLFLEQYVQPPARMIGDAPPVDLPNPSPPAALITYNGNIYSFRSLHFHAPTSEHVIDNAVGAIEMHLIFERRGRARPSPPPNSSPSNNSSDRSASTSLTSSLVDYLSPSLTAVAAESESSNAKEKDKPQPQPPKTIAIAVIGKESDTSVSWLGTLLDAFISKAGKDGSGPGITADLDLKTVLSEFDSSDLYAYSGSLTSPPCTEGVFWFVLGSRIPVSAHHRDMIAFVQRGSNVRPLQQVNDRQVTRFPPAPKPPRDYFAESLLQP